MTQKQGKPSTVHVDIRKLKRKPESNFPSFSREKIEALIEEAVVDAYGDDEQTGGFITMIEEHLALPFTVSILGIEAVVEKVDMTRDVGLSRFVGMMESSRGLKSSIFRCPSPLRQARSGLRHTAIGVEGFR